MYICELHFIIISGSDRIQRVIESIKLPERTKLDVLTCAGLHEKITEIDTAVIFDSSDSYKKSAGLVGGYAKTILLENRPDIVEDEPDEIWLVPFGDDLMRFHAAKLIEHMKLEFDHRRLETCFNTAFDSIPDLVWFKDIKGSHLWVNDSFCSAVDKTKAQIFDRGHYYIWDIPKEEYEQGEYVCLESEDVVMNEGKTCLFDEKVKTKAGMKQFKTYKSPLYDIDGSAFGTCGIANDVTSLHNVNSEIEAILETMPFAVVIEDEKGNVVSVSSTFFDYFPQYRDGVSEIDSKSFKELVNSDQEIHVADTDGNEIILTVFEKNIYSIFHDVIGKLIILTDVTKERQSHQQILFNANTDFLTGLYNRRKLFSFLDTIKKEPVITMICVDLDNFKKINDKYGHAMGDKALVETARIMCTVFDNDFIARLGGDEFLIISTRNNEGRQLIPQIETLLKALQDSFGASVEFSSLNASIGFVSENLGDGEHDLERLMRESDKALYQAKTDGKGCIREYIG